MAVSATTLFLRRVAEGMLPRLRATTVPVLAEQDGVQIGGSGFLFKIADDAFLVTAAHVLEVQTKHQIRLYVPDTEDSAMTLGGEFVAPRDGERFDVAVVRLAKENLVALEARGHQFLRADLAREIRPSDPPEGGYVLYGFPERDALRHDSGELEPRPVYRGCTPWEGDPKDLPALDFDPDVHLLLNLGGPVQDGVTGEVHPPELAGMSGCSVWHMYSPAHRDGQTEWNPDVPRLIGVQSAVFRTQRAIKVVSWSAVKVLLTRMWPDLERPLNLVPSNSRIVREVSASTFIRKHLR